MECWAPKNASRRYVLSEHIRMNTGTIRTDADTLALIREAVVTNRSHDLLKWILETGAAAGRIIE